MREIPSPEPFDDEEDEDIDETSEAIVPEEDKRGRIRRLFDHLHHRLRFLLIGAYRRNFVVPPDIWEMCHYPQCRACQRYLELQGWEAEFKVSEENKIYEVTFRSKERKKGGSQFYV